MKTIRVALFISFSLSCFSCTTGLQSPQFIVQKTIKRITMMSALPQPYNMLNWGEMALTYDSLVYDFNASGEYWPLIWLDDSRKNLDQTTFGIYTAIGDVRQGPDKNGGMFHESINSLGSLLGASLMGIDKSDQGGYNYVKMVQNYFNTENGWNIIMNNTCPDIALQGGGYARDWWYDVFPNVLFYGLASFYPEEGITEEILLSIAEQFYKADSVLNGNYDYSFFNYATMSGEKNHITSQEDAAAGHAYILYSAYQRFGDERYLAGAKSALSAMEKLSENRFYEILMPFGAYVAARLNAEHGTQFDPSLWIEWSFDPAVGRKGWGVLVGDWNGYDISGLVGSIIHNDGYGFLMNTFDMAWPLVPMVRYDPSYANAIGKWMLHAANAAHLMYPDLMADDHQTLPGRKDVTKGVIAYEAIIHHSDFEDAVEIQAPVAQGDGPNWVPGENPDVSQFSIYGSGHVGIFGSIIDTTNVEGILELDLLATDFYREDAYPTHLYYNPYNEAKEIMLTGQPASLYDLITKSTIIATESKVMIPPGASLVLVDIPEDGKWETINGQLYIDGVIVDYHQ